MPPRTTWTVFRIQHHVRHAPALQMIRRREARLASTDDYDVGCGRIHSPMIVASGCVADLLAGVRSREANSP